MQTRGVQTAPMGFPTLLHPTDASTFGLSTLLALRCSDRPEGIPSTIVQRANSNWALPQIIDALDDPFLLNRQFAGRALESMTGIKLDSYGYQFYMGPAERAGPLTAIRSGLLLGQASRDSK